MKFNNSLLLTRKYILLFFILCYGTNLSLAKEKHTKDPFGHITNPTPEILPTYSGTCDDLQTITGFEHLLSQIYKHLDDDCLYLMTPNELSKKLGIEVYAHQDIETGKFLKYRYRELEQKPYTDLRSGIFLHKLVFKLEGRGIEKLSLKEQRQHNFKGMTNWITYNIAFSTAYLDKHSHPFLKYSPTTLSKPHDFTASYEIYDYGSCGSSDKDNYRQSRWLKNYGIYYWHGYTKSKIKFNNCSTGTSFQFSKLFYLK